MNDKTELRKNQKEILRKNKLNRKKINGETKDVRI